MSESSQNSELILPLSMVAGRSETKFQKDANILFINGREVKIENQQFRFQSGTLHKRTIESLSAENERIHFSGGVPYFSIFAVILLIFFRNLYFAPFQKYFLNPVNNYEIDFSFQKIGILPLLLSVFTIFLAVGGFFYQNGPGGGLERIFPMLRLPFEIFAYPILISIGSLFFLSLSGKIFPLIFSDIKIFFGLSLLFLLWNFSSFGSDIERIIPAPLFFVSISVLFFLLRSILFFQVLRRAYRFQMPLTLFYICTLNLSTFLILFRSVQIEFL